MKECTLCFSIHDVQVHHVDGHHSNDDSRNRVHLCADCHRRLHATGGRLTEDILDRVRSAVQQRINQGEQPRGLRYRKSVATVEDKPTLFRGEVVGKVESPPWWPALPVPQYRMHRQYKVSIRVRRPHVSGMRRNPRIVFESSFETVQCSIEADVKLESLSPDDLDYLLEYGRNVRI